VNGSLIGTFGSGYSAPESILFNTSGQAYIGNTGGGILKKDAAGNALLTYNAGRVDWMDLGADQTTMFFTTELSLTRISGQVRGSGTG